MVAAEDTRTTRRLLGHVGASPELVSYHAHSAPARRDALVGRLQASDIALVSDAGTPGISDPGARLVAAARANGHNVVAIPGPSAVSAALSVSGIPADSYVFLGFLPRKAAERRRVLTRAAVETRTLVAFETPHRLRASLADLAATFGDRPLAIAREITKLHEEVWHGSAREAERHWSDIEPRGEFTLVIAGAPPREEEPWDDEAVERELESLREAGMGPKEASRLVARKANRPARDVYRLWPHRSGAPPEGESTIGGATEEER